MIKFVVFLIVLAVVAVVAAGVYKWLENILPKAPEGGTIFDDEVAKAVEIKNAAVVAKARELAGAKTCKEEFGDAAFFDVFQEKCYSCPASAPIRTLAGVTEANACTKDLIFGPVAKAIEHRSGFGTDGVTTRESVRDVYDFKKLGYDSKNEFLVEDIILDVANEQKTTKSWWACPKGYKRTASHIKADDACKAVTSCKTRFPPVAPDPSAPVGSNEWLGREEAFEDTNKNEDATTCRACPAGFCRSAVHVNDPNACSRPCKTAKFEPLPEPVVAGG